MSHLGRPKSGPDPNFSLKLVAQRLSEVFQRNVQLAPDCVGAEVANLVGLMTNGDILLLENVRFHPEEEANDSEFGKQLGSVADIYVNDAFGTAHRAHASTEGVTKYVQPSVAGFLLRKELDYLQGVVTQPQRPFAALIGGAKVSSKIGVMESLVMKVDKLILGGAMVFTFLKARGYNVGSSKVEDAQLDVAKRVEALAQKMGVELIFPVDFVIADKFAADANTKIVPFDKIPDGWMGLDNGPETTKMIKESLNGCATILWNGPMGVAEFDKFSAGTVDVALALAELTKKGATTIVGGGDSVAAVEKAGVASLMSHVSTGGGASLELLEGKVLPGVAALTNASPVAA